MLRVALIVLAAASIFGLPNAHAASAPTVIGTADETFLRGYFDHQWLAIAYSSLATERGSNAALRKFAQSELDMYRALADKAAALLPATGVKLSVLRSLAGELGKLDANANALVDEQSALAALQGAAFDKAYLPRVIMLHQRMMRHSLRLEQASGMYPATLAFAREALATLNQQNEAAENLFNGRPQPTGPPPAL